MVFLLSDASRRLIQHLNETEDPIDDSDDFPDDDDSPVMPQPTRKPTYPQDWPAYDAAKTNEDVLFKRLLQDLLLLAVENPGPAGRAGRKGFDTRTKLFCMCIKEYYKSDLRKTTSILKELHHLHLIAKVPCYKSIDNFYNDTTLAPLLDRLILLTALPLAPIERTAAIDGTGFSVSKYESWFDHKWGTHTERTRCWRKLHAVIGCTTNIFLSAEVTEKNVADITMLPTAVGDKPRYFQFQDLVADKAYSSRDVFNFLDKLGLDAYIPFKRGSSSEPKGSRLWHDMFVFMQRCPDEYDLHYHQRSNVESCFHMLKTRYGHHLLTKHFPANQAEIKTRVLCHNLCVLIQEAAERGIIPKFDTCVRILNPVQK